ncbi:MAG TPA: FAD-dependent oxidoreductase [Burkholderiaceae bacterium]|jgi:NADPH-dependent 2,4-dienoyl-CoA reductase/sulfur reductase-like enzyme/nitrite reductase/ring-hydroxylating ferredoxin subunit|nr:FAD-dependent oxidoreductase [Burkholderiaceae bacterium]
MSEQNDPRLDFAAGVPLADLPEGRMIAGRVGADDALLLRRGDRVQAFGALCSHYHGPLADGLVVGDTVRCPWHHACFDIGTGEALRAPALDPIPCWRVEQRDGRAFAGERIVAGPRERPPVAGHPQSVVIVGGGVAGLAAAQMLRRAGYTRKLTMVSADDSPPCDRPNLSKDFLAGTAQADWIPLRPPEFYRDNDIELLLSTRVTALDAARRTLTLASGRELAWEALLLATGADPIRLEIPGADPSRVHVLRSFADSRGIVAQLPGARRALVVGSSFIGLEAAASLRTRGLEVHVVGLDKVPMAAILGEALGRRVRELHESHGVVFHLGTSVERMDGATARLADGTSVDGCDFVVLGVGVRPSLALAQQAGLATDRGVVVDATLRTSAAGVWAAGDIARWPDPRSGEAIRVEHFALAEAQGQCAALNMLGAKRPFDTVPFFWSQHYDTAINMVGHAAGWDRVAVDGSPEALDAAVRYFRGDKLLAMATLGRDLESLRCEAAFEGAAAPAR